MRRIIAEKQDWTLAVVPTLHCICLQCIVDNFEENPVFLKLTPTQRELIQEKLSLSLSPLVTGDLIPDGVYWKRCCECRWDLCNLDLYDHSWKQMFFERHLGDMIELFIPGVTEPKTILVLLPLCGKYVKRLNVSQLLPPIKEPQKEKEEDEYDLDLAANKNDDEPAMDHFDFSLVLDKLSNLKELHLVYRVKQCGLNFAWNMFEMTDSDCVSLGKAIKSCRTLRVLRLHQSHVKNNQCRVLVKNLLDHPTLRELDFSYNLIGDSGANSICELLTRSKLEILNLCYNKIGPRGATALADALSNNSSLLSLNLRLNLVGDEGGQAICKALQKNKTLRQLHLGGNDLTGITASALSEVLLKNQTLRSINLSCNTLGVNAGKDLVKAMSHNTTLTELDTGLTEIDEQDALFINKKVWDNQSPELK